MDWQLTITLMIVALASCYLATRGWRVWRARKTSCGGSCASTAASVSNPQNTRLIDISLDKLGVPPTRAGPSGPLS